MQDDWYQVAAGKGLLVLDELRRLVGDDTFNSLMLEFGEPNAGKPVTSAAFQAAAEKASGKKLDDFFGYWLKETGLPALTLGKVTVREEAEGKYRIDVAVNGASGLARQVPVFVETAEGEEHFALALEKGSGAGTFTAKARPRRVVLDKYGQTAHTAGGVYSAASFNHELDKTLIVYGTLEEASANREAAETLQKAIITRWSNFTVPFKSDKEVTADDLKNHHLLLIGRPDCNALVEKFQAALPVQFGTRSFTARGDTYAHMDSAVVAAAANPANPRYSVVVVAGLGAAATLKAAPTLATRGDSAGEVILLPHGGKPKALVVPPKELVYECRETGKQNVSR
jgi:hypothetical protein